MQHITKLIKLEDKEKLVFYLDYTDQLIEFYAKRNLDTTDLKIEYEMLQNRISELTD